MGDAPGRLWRAKRTSPTAATKTPIDLFEDLARGFTNNAKIPIYVDHLELVKIKKIETKGGFAFDFGRHGTQVMPQWTGVFEDTKFDPKTGYGFIGEPPIGLSKAMSYPTPLLGDGLPLGAGEGSHAPTASGFKVTLPGGDYQGWIAFERGGFWEDEASGYSHADLKVDGTMSTLMISPERATSSRTRGHGHLADQREAIYREAQSR